MPARPGGRCSQMRLFTVLLAVFQLGAVAMDPGVPRDLARIRAEMISDVRYRLSFELAPGAAHLKGRVEIKLRLRRPSDHVVLDFRDLDGSGKIIDGTINDVTINRQSVTDLPQLNGH